MKVFLAGATGVVGWRSAERLVRAGHEVTGVARSREKAAKLRTLGARAAEIDLFDRAILRAAVAGHDVVINLATRIPSGVSALLPSSWRENDRIRQEASKNLVDAAIAAGAARYIQESIALIYPDRGREWIDESVEPKITRTTRSVLSAEAETKRFSKLGGAGVGLRFALFYGPDSTHTRDIAKLVRKGTAPLFGSPEGYISSIATDDAAAAVVAALSLPSGIYNVADDEPVTGREYVDSMAAFLHVPPPRAIPAWIGRITRPMTETMSRSQRISSQKLRAATGWTPSHRSVKEGWKWALGGAKASASRGPSGSHSAAR